MGSGSGRRGRSWGSCGDGCSRWCCSDQDVAVVGGAAGGWFGHSSISGLQEQCGQSGGGGRGAGVGRGAAVNWDRA